MTRCWLVFGLLSMAPASAWPHGGEDHSESERPAAAAHELEPGAAEARSELFELVIKYPQMHSPEPVVLRLFLADYATNTPVPEASIQLQFTNPQGLTVAATPTSVAGVYEAAVTFPEPGSYALLAIITASEAVDLLPVEGIDVTPPQTAAATEGEATHPEGIPQWALGAGAVALGLLAFLLGLAVGRRRGPLAADEEVLDEMGA